MVIQNEIMEIWHDDTEYGKLVHCIQELTNKARVKQMMFKHVLDLTT